MQFQTWAAATVPRRGSQVWSMVGRSLGRLKSVHSAQAGAQSSPVPNPTGPACSLSMLACSPAHTHAHPYIHSFIRPKTSNCCAMLCCVEVMLMMIMLRLKLQLTVRLQKPRMVGTGVLRGERLFSRKGRLHWTSRFDFQTAVLET